MATVLVGTITLPLSGLSLLGMLQMTVIISPWTESDRKYHPDNEMVQLADYNKIKSFLAERVGEIQKEIKKDN